MANGATMRVTGLQQFNAVISHLSDAVSEGIDDELEAAAYEMRSIADSLITDNGSIDQGFLKSSLQVVPVSGNHRAEFLNTAFYAPFVEFGTGPQVRVPQEWAEYAAQFKGMQNGNTEQFISNIKDWIGRKQIPIPPGYNLDSFAAQIVLSILVKGLKARPFMYPAYRYVAELLPGRIEKRLNDATR